MKRSQKPSRSRIAAPAQHALEALEVRCLFSTLVVTTTTDDVSDGQLSLRAAIAEANAEPAGTVDTINFAIPQASPLPATGPAVMTINVGSTGNGALPALTRPVKINGYTESGASANTLGVGDNAKILIELNGSNAGANASGLTLGAGSGGSTIEGLAVNRFSTDGILVQSNGNVIEGNFLGTNPQGNAAEGNQVDGIRLSFSSDDTVGGTIPAARNVSSGNHIDGIHVFGTTAQPAAGNHIENNYVGVNAAGTGAVGIKPNGGATGSPSGNSFFGIEITGGDKNTVGGTSSAYRNVVGLNAAGIEVDNGGQGNVIEGNYSGVGADGVTPIGNNLHGIVIRSAGTLGAPLGPGQTNEPAVSGNIIGLNPVTLTGLGNLVEFNGTAGIAVFGNPLPNNPHPAQNNGNSILGNSIFENGRSNPAALLGILLTNEFTFPKDGPFVPNDADGHGDANAPNNWQDGPILTSAVQTSTGGVQVKGSMTQKVSPDTKYILEFFTNNPDPLKAAPEAQTLIGTEYITTGAGGGASFSYTFSHAVSAGQIITADATNVTPDPSVLAGSDSLYDTSDLSTGTRVTTGSTTPTPTPTGTRFELINPANGAQLGQITNGEVISLSQLHVSSLNVAVSTSPASQSTTFGIDGVYKGLSNAPAQTLLNAEHSTQGLGVGTYVLTVQTFTETYGRGIASAFDTIGFRIEA